MINVSNAFKNELYLDHRNYLEYADITLLDETKLNLTNKDFWQGGVSLDDAVSGNDAFEIGAAIVNSCSLTIENLDDRFSEYDFLNAKVVTYIGLNLPDGTTEKIRKGTYTVNDPKYNGATISLNCQDNMAMFDRPYSESKLTYPATLGSIVQDACSVCGVTLQTPTFTHSDFVVQTRPADEAITFREVISWAAQIAGCFCRCDVYGRLELKWYNQQLLEKHGYDGGIFDKVSSTRYTTGDNVDGGTFNPWSTGDVVDGGTFEEMEGIHHIYSHYSAPVISTDDVVITGVRVLEKAKEQDEETGSEKDVIITYQSGSDGYVVSIENNELIQGGAGLQISNWLGQQLIGFRFRKASLNHASDPTIEAGDIAIVTDRKQNTYPIIISSTRFSTGSAQSTESSAETPARNSAARFSATTKNYVEYRKDIEKERTEREKAQKELKDRIDNSSGLYTTEQIQPDGSTIFYMHDKPTLGESKIVWKMTAEAWGVSTDGGDTYNAGMTVDGDTIVRILTATGINADWIKAGAFRIEKNGEVIFLADADTKRVEIVADSFSLTSGETIDSIAESAVNDFISKTYDPKIAEIQKQLDGQIESFYYNYAPTLTNIPASGWTTEIERAKHEGDLFYDKSTGYAYRFFKDGSAWKWQMIQDTDITKALENAATAQDTADHKRRTFLTTPTPPYDKGDLWYGGTDSDVKVCTTARASGSYVSTDWTKQDKYIDQSAANTAATNAVNGQTQESIFNKLTDSGKAKGIILKDGQLYVSATYMQTGAVKVAKNGKTIFLADMDAGKVEIVADSFSLSSGATIDSIAQSKANAALEDAKTYADTTAKDAVNDAMTQQNIFNKLTNGGEKQGIYLSGGKIYLNAEYLQVTYLSSISTNLGTITAGKLQSAGYSYTSGNFSTGGTLIDLSSNVIRSRQFFIDSAGNAYFAGNLSAAKGTFSGELSAATGTFSGSLSAATGTFSGTLSAAKGTFSGELSAATGTFKGSLSATSGTLGTITAGKLQSAGYSYTSGNFSGGGILIDLSSSIIRSKQFSIDSSGNAYFAGNLSAAKGTFSGELSAATGTFKGELSAATGTFKGELSAASGTFKGSLSAASGTLGTITAGSLQSAGYSYTSGNFSTRGFLVDLSSNVIRSRQFFIDSAGNAYFAGNLSAATGTFSGTLSAAKGTFSGELSAATGTFSGSLSASTGTFKGSLSAATGTFNGSITNKSGDLSIEISNGSVRSYYKNLWRSTFGYASGTYSEGVPLDDVITLDFGSPMVKTASGSTFSIILGSKIYMLFSTGYNIKTYANMEIAGDVIVRKNFTVTGSKARVVQTKNYSKRLLYAYETPSPAFGDTGEAVTDENGECYIFLDDIFSETVSSQIEYQVFLQKEGPGDVWIDSKEPAFFAVKGTPNLKFAWEIKAKQKGYEYERLENYTKEETEEIDYEEQYLEELESLIREQEEMYL